MERRSGTPTSRSWVRRVQIGTRLGRLFEPRAIALAFTTLLLLVFIAYPLSLVLIKSFPMKGPLWSNYLKVLSGGRGYRSLINTLYTGALVTVLSTVAGVATAWLLTRSDIPFKRVFRTLILLTFITPAYIGAVAWIQLLGRSGYVNSLLMNALSLGAPPINLYSLEGVIIIMTIHLYPLVFLITSNALSAADPSLEEAAALSGGARVRVFTTITLPLILPSILSGAVLVFLRTISCFGVPAAICLPTGNYVLTTRIYAELSHYDVRMACAISVISVILAGISLLIHHALLRGKRYTGITFGSRRPVLISLGRWRIPATAALFMFTSVTILLPMGSILLFSFLKVWGIKPILENLTLGNYGKMLSEGLTARAMGNSLMFAGLSATAAIAIGLFSSYISTRTKIKGRRILDFLATMPLAIPGPVLACACILAWTKPPLPLYNTPWIIIIAYVVACTPHALRNVSGLLRNLDPTLEEAGWVSGGSWTKTMRDITIPLMMPGIWTGWILSFLIAIREIPLSTMLYTQGTETVGFLLLSLRSSSGGLEVISAMSVIVIAMTIVGQLIVERLGGKRIWVL